MLHECVSRKQQNVTHGKPVRTHFEGIFPVEPFPGLKRLNKLGHKLGRDDLGEVRAVVRRLNLCRG